MDDLDPGQLRRQGVDRGLHLEPQPETRVARQHMVGKGVAAHEDSRVGGAGPDDGHPAQRRAPVAEQRQRRPGLEQDDRPLGHLPGQGAVGGRVEVDGGRTGHRALGRPVRVEQPELRLLREEPAGGPVHEGLRQLAPPDPLHQAGAEADGVRQLDVDAGGERLGAGLVEVRGDAVHARQERHGPVVGDDAAREPPLLPQQVGEQPVVRTRGDPVHVGVGVHHRAGAAHGHGRLERRQDDVHELAPAHRHGSVVPSRPGGGVPGEVLQGGDDAGALQAPHVGGAEHRDEVGILAHGLLDAAPAVVPHDVQHRRETLVHADGRHVPPDRGRHPLDQVGANVAPQAIAAG